MNPVFRYPRYNYISKFKIYDEPTVGSWFRLPTLLLLTEKTAHFTTSDRKDCQLYYFRQKRLNTLLLSTEKTAHFTTSNRKDCPLYYFRQKRLPTLLLPTEKTAHFTMDSTPAQGKEVYVSCKLFVLL